MTAEQLAAQLHAKIAEGRQPDERLDEKRVFCRGWNGGLDYVERCIREVLGENPVA